MRPLPHPYISFESRNTGELAVSMTDSLNQSHHMKRRENNCLSSLLLVSFPSKDFETLKPKPTSGDIRANEPYTSTSNGNHNAFCSCSIIEQLTLKEPIVTFSAPELKLLTFLVSGGPL